MTYETTLARVRAMSEGKFVRVAKKPIRLEPEFIRAMQTQEPPIAKAAKQRSCWEDWGGKII